MGAKLKRLNDGVIRNNKEERQGILYEFKQMDHSGNRDYFEYHTGVSV